MNKKISLGVAATIVILAMTVTFSVTMLLAMRLFDSTVTSVKEKESMYSKLSELDRYVRANSFYAIDDTLLYDTLCSGYLVGTGDKYARYYTAEAYTELLNVQNGTLMGIGVELGRDQTGYARVLKVYEDSPAQEAGILEGYYITAVNGADVKLMSSIDTVQARLRGEAGTTVTVTWLDAEKVETTADLTHSGYSITTVDSQMLADNVGYIRIRQFDSATPSELDYAIRSLTAAAAGKRSHCHNGCRRYGKRFLKCFPFHRNSPSSFCQKKLLYASILWHICTSLFYSFFCENIAKTIFYSLHPLL